MVHEFFETKLNFPKENFETNNFWILEIFLKIHSEYDPLIVQNCSFLKQSKTNNSRHMIITMQNTSFCPLDRFSANQRHFQAQ